MNLDHLLALVVEQRQVAVIQISMRSLGYSGLSGAAPELTALINCLRVANVAQVLITDFIDPASVAEGLKPCCDRVNSFLTKMARDGEVFKVGEPKQVESDVYAIEVELGHEPIQPVAIGVKPK